MRNTLKCVCYGSVCFFSSYQLNSLSLLFIREILLLYKVIPLGETTKYLQMKTFDYKFKKKAYKKSLKNFFCFFESKCDLSYFCVVMIQILC